MKALYEQYRPSCWAEVVAQDKAIAKIQTVGKRGLAGRAWFISGNSGSGKSTIAYIMAHEVADDLQITELDALKLTPSRLADAERDMQYMGWGATHKTGKVYIINEATRMSDNAIGQLLVLLERLPQHVMIIFTTTAEAQAQLFETKLDCNALLSRCIEVKLARRDLAAAFAERVKEIAVQEGLDGQPIEAYKRLATRTHNNMRAMLQAVESGEMLE